MPGEVVRWMKDMKTLRIVPMLAVAIAVIAGLAAPAAAHAAYKSSDPPDAGQVSSPPGEVTATFSEPLAGGSFLEVSDPCGTRVDEGDVRIVGYDMSVSMSAAAAGRYTVFYRAFSTLDPHVTEGTFGFTAISGDACTGEAGPSGPAAPPEGSAGGGGADEPREASVASGGSTSRDAGSDRTPRAGSPARAESGPASVRTGGKAAVGERDKVRTGAGEGEVDLAASPEEDESEPSVWDGIRLEPFLTGLLLAAIIGAAGGKMYAGIMGPRG